MSNETTTAVILDPQHIFNLFVQNLTGDAARLARGNHHTILAVMPLLSTMHICLSCCVGADEHGNAVAHTERTRSLLDHLEAAQRKLHNADQWHRLQADLRQQAEDAHLDHQD